MVIKFSMPISTSGILLISQHVYIKCHNQVSNSLFIYKIRSVLLCLLKFNHTSVLYVLYFMIITITVHLSCFWHDTSVNINKMYNHFLHKVYFFHGKKNKTFPVDLSSPHISSLVREPILLIWTIF